MLSFNQNRPFIWLSLAYLTTTSPTALAQSTGAVANSVEQESATSDAIDDDNGETKENSDVETLFVTAQKRREDIQDVPVAVSVIGTDTINKSFSNTVENLQMLVPTLTFRKGTTTRNSALTLRGVGTISFSIAAEPSVSTIVDGVVMARSGQAFTDLYDLAQIEVLRGPQGTLFGKNASAGAINITTLGGSEVFETRLSATAFEGEEYRVKASVAGPIAKNLTGRVTGFFGSFSGNITNLYTDGQINGYNRFGARGILEYEPLPDFKLKLIADYYEGNDDCCAEIAGVSANTDDSIDRDALRGVELDGIDTRTVNHNLVTQTQDETMGISITAEIPAPLGHTATTILAYRNWQNTEIREGDFFPGAYVGITELHDTGVQEFNQYSAELRIASPEFKYIDYVAGLFAWRAESERSFTREDIVCTDSPIPVDPNTGAQPCVPGRPDVPAPSTVTFPTSTANMTSGFTNFGLFGQANIHFTSRLRLLGGARLIHDSVEYTHQRNAAEVAGPGVLPVGTDFADSTEDTNFSGKTALQFDILKIPAVELMTYISYTRGYKGPAFNVFYNMGPNNLLPIDAETSNSFESGIKSSFLNRRINLNLTGFWADYENFQANNFVVIDGALTTTLTNAGDVRTRGFELDLIATPFSWLRLNGGLGLTDAAITEFNTNPQDPSDQNDRSGDRLPLAPEVKVALASTINFPVKLGTLDLLGNLNSQFSYTSMQYSSIGDAEGPQGPIDEYALWHASVGVSDTGANHTVTFIVRNLLDQSFVTLNTAASSRLHIPRDADRYAGINYTLSY